MACFSFRALLSPFWVETAIYLQPIIERYLRTHLRDMHDPNRTDETIVHDAAGKVATFSLYRRISSVFNNNQGRS